jgi:transposase
MQSEETHMELKALRRHGWSVSALAREFGLSRSTVRKELAAEAPRCYPARAKPTALSEAQLAHIERRLEVCPGIRGTLLHAELVEDYAYRGSYVAFMRHQRRLRPSAVKEPEVRVVSEPGRQVQADWAHLGLWPLSESMLELYAMVCVLGFSRAVALRFATDLRRETAFEKLGLCLADLGGAPYEALTDRDPAFCIGQTSDGRPILAPQWVDVSRLLGVVPRVCRPYRAKTKGKVERVVREVKESFLAWMTGRPLPSAPTLADYDELGRVWAEQVVGRRRHRTTGRIVAEAWAEERELLEPIPARILAQLVGPLSVLPSRQVVDVAQRLQGEQVEVRDLADYEVAVR